MSTELHKAASEFVAAHKAYLEQCETTQILYEKRDKASDTLRPLLKTGEGVAVGDTVVYLNGYEMPDAMQLKVPV